MKMPYEAWWQARTVRERQMLTALAVLFLLLFLWLLILRPLADARAAADARVTLAVTNLAQVRAQAAMAQPRPAASGEPVPLPLDGFLMQSAGEQGLANVQVSADGPTRATISVPSVRPQAFFGWIAALEARGVLIDALSARANADQTIAAEAVLRTERG